jgi:aspartyl-tRNA synthetase
MVMLLAGGESLRDVIAFPKNKAAVSMMDEAPNEVSNQQLKELHLKIELDK